MRRLYHPVPHLLLILCVMNCSSQYLTYNYDNFSTIMGSSAFQLKKHSEIEAKYNVPEPMGGADSGGIFLFDINSDCLEQITVPKSSTFRVRISYFCASEDSELRVDSMCFQTPQQLCKNVSGKWEIFEIIEKCSDYLPDNVATIVCGSSVEGEASGYEFIEIYTNDDTTPLTTTTTTTLHPTVTTPETSAVTTVSTTDSGITSPPTSSTTAKHIDSTDVTSTTTAKTVSTHDTSPSTSSTSSKHTDSTDVTTTTTAKTVSTYNTSPSTSSTAPKHTYSTDVTITTTATTESSHTTTDAPDYYTTTNPYSTGQTTSSTSRSSLKSTTHSSVYETTSTESSSAVGVCGESECIFGLTEIEFLTTWLSVIIGILLIFVIVLAVCLVKQQRILVKVMEEHLPFHRDTAVSTTVADPTSYTQRGRRGRDSNGFVDPTSYSESGRRGRSSRGFEYVNRGYPHYQERGYAGLGRMQHY